MCAAIIFELLDEGIHARRSLLVVVRNNLERSRSNSPQIFPRHLPLPQEVNRKRAAHDDHKYQNRGDQMVEGFKFSLQMAFVGLGDGFDIRIVHYYLAAGLLVGTEGVLEGLRPVASRIGSM